MVSPAIVQSENTIQFWRRPWLLNHLVRPIQHRLRNRQTDLLSRL